MPLDTKDIITYVNSQDFDTLQEFQTKIDNTQTRLLSMNRLLSEAESIQKQHLEFTIAIYREKTIIFLPKVPF